MITWDTTAAPTGGDWDTPGNWVGGVIPTASNNVVIDLASAGTVTYSTGASDAALSLSMTNASLSLTGGSIALRSGSSSLGSITLGPGASLSVATNASVTLQTNQTLTDSGSMTFSQGDTVNVSDSYGTGQIVVNGSLSVTGTTFVNGGNTSQIVVNSGGHTPTTRSISIQSPTGGVRNCRRW